MIKEIIKFNLIDNIKSDNREWFIDSNTSRYMIFNRDFFVKLKFFDRDDMMKFANNEKLPFKELDIIRV